LLMKCAPLILVVHQIEEYVRNRWHGPSLIGVVMRQKIFTLPVLALTLASMSVPLAGATTAHGSKPKVVHADGYTCTVVGTPGADKLTGKAGDVVCGLGGNDQLTASGPGLIVLIGGAGNDKLTASTSQSANDVLLGDSGNDVLIGGAGIDDLDGGSGQNTDTSGTATTTVDEESGATTLACASAAGTVVEVGTSSDDHHGVCKVAKTSVYAAQAFLAGKISAVTATTIDVTTTSVSSGAVAWLAANGNPATVTINVASAKIAREGGGALQVGDRVRAGVNLPVSGTTLSGLFVRAEGVSSTTEDNEPTAALRFQGAVTQVGAASITVAYRSTNGAGLSWLAANQNPTTVTFDITGAQIERRGGTAVVVGDRVEVSANAPATGTVLLAVKVEAAPASTEKPTSSQLGLVGTITSVTATTVDVAIRVANDAATTWLAANQNPTTVTVDISAARIEREGGGSLTVGDRVVVHATQPTSGKILLGVEIEATSNNGQHTEVSAPLEFQGVVATAGTSTATVTLREANRATRTWLAANGNLTTVTIDLSTAQVRRAGGGSLQVGDKVEVTASFPQSGTTLVAQRVNASSPGGEHQNIGALVFAGTIASVSPTSIDVTLSQLNDAARTYLSGKGNPTVVTVTVGSARVLRSHGGVLTVGDAVVVSAPAPASGTTFVATQIAAEPAEHGHNDH